MNMKKQKKLLSLVLSAVLVAAVTLSMIGCGDNGDKGNAAITTANRIENPAETNGTADAADPAGTDAETADAGTTGSAAGNPSDGGDVGEGEKSFAFTVVDADGNETKFTVHTDEDTVGAALLALGLIEGEDGAYGLYVKTVNGITADYDVDGTYFAFYIDGEYAMTGVDATDITEGATYSFVVSK